MRVHINTKQISRLGMLLALSSVIILIANFIQVSTLFFMALAAVMLGVAIRESDMYMGFAYMVAAVLLSFLIMANKLHCLTYAAMLIYVYVYELLRKKNVAKYKAYIIKYLIFNIIYIPVLLFMPGLILSDTIKISTMVYVIMIVAGQIILYIFDRIYEIFIQRILLALSKYR